MNAVIYLAYCVGTGKVYVGCSLRTMADRRAEHHFAAVNGSPYKFHRALRELGLSAFQWRIVETVPPATMYARERFWIERFNSFRAGYNSTPGGPQPPPRGVSNATRYGRNFKKPRPHGGMIRLRR